MQRFVDHAAAIAAFACAAAIVAFGARFDAFSHLQHPVGLLGASRVPGATAYNMLAFVLPGALAALSAIALRGGLRGAGGSARVGAQAVLLSALAFAAQGVFPLDSGDLDGGSSRLHAAAWTVWWISTGVGGALLAAGLASRRDRRVVAGALCFLAVVAFALVLPGVLPAGVSQRVALAAWFAGLWLARPVSRDAA